MSLPVLYRLKNRDRPYFCKGTKNGSVPIFLAIFLHALAAHADPSCKVLDPELQAFTRAIA